MKDFNHILSVCKETSRITSAVVDEFLLYYAADRYNLVPEMDKKFAAYRHIIKEFPEEWENRIKAQYIGHRIFRNDGLINKLLNHSALKRFNNKEMEFLKFQAENPWRFCFSTIVESLSTDFYLMADVFRDEEFLLYSPGVTTTLESQPAIMWFNMIAFNGSCWQTYGPIIGYGSFEPDDIFFFAAELNPDIEDDDDLLLTVEDNPVPFMMLLSGANYPLVFSKKDLVVQTMAEYDLEKIDTQKLSADFKKEYNDGVYRLSLKRWSGPPHFSQAYYDENKMTITLSAMTDRGFIALVDVLNKYGYQFSSEPFIRVKPLMVSTASEILGKNIDLNEYDDLFTKESSPARKEGLNKLNKLMDLVMNDINAGRQPDVEAYAKKAGVDPQEAMRLVSHVLDKLNKMGKGGKK